MLISRKMAEAVQGGCRPVRHDALVGSALPGKSAGRELQPGFPQREMVRNRRAGQVIDRYRGRRAPGRTRPRSVGHLDAPGACEVLGGDGVDEIREALGCRGQQRLAAGCDGAEDAL